MPQEVISYISQYGYLAVFVLVFLQEIGVPNPVPNELVLLFSGYLAFSGTLSLLLVLLSAIAADFIGTALLYFIFYFFGRYFFSRPRRWLPISKEKIDGISDKISKKGGFGIFLGRLIPYLRGYFSVAAGVFRIKPRVFLPAVIFSAAVWSGGYVLIGSILGPYGGRFIEEAKMSTIFLIVLTMAGCFFGLRFLIPFLAGKIKKSPN